MPNRPDQPARCELCHRRGVALTKHHLIPRARHNKPRTRRQHELSRDEMNQQVAYLCRPCHKTVHATLSEQTLAEHYHTVARLAEHDDIARFVAFVRKQAPDAKITVRLPNARR